MAKDEDFKLLKIQTCILKVNLHCNGCKHKVKKILQRIEGVIQVSIDAEEQKVTVSGSVDTATLIKKLVKSGKHAEIWSNKSNNNQNQSQNQKAACMKDDKKTKGIESLENQQKVQTLTSIADDGSLEDDEVLKVLGGKSNQVGTTSANNPRNLKNKSQPTNGNGKKGQNVGGQNGNFQDLNEGKSVNVNANLGSGGGGGNLGGFEMANGGQHMMMNMNGLRYNQQQQGYNHQQQQEYNQQQQGYNQFMMNMNMNMQNRQAMYQRPPIMPPNTGYYHNYNPAPYPFPYNEPPHSYYYNGSNCGGDAYMVSDENTSSCSIM